MHPIIVAESFRQPLIYRLGQLGFGLSRGELRVVILIPKGQTLNSRARRLVRSGAQSKEIAS